MAGSKLKALGSSGRSAWADGKVGNKERKLFLFDSLLLHCPVPGVSSAGNILLEFDNCNSQEAKRRLNECLQGIDGDSIYHHLELRRIARWLIDNKFDTGSVPNGSHEFVCFAESPTGVLKDHYGLFVDRKRSELTASDRAPYADVLVLDAFFRHLRNAVAHGAFREVRRKSGNEGKLSPYIYFQDTNRQRQITARMFLSYERIESIGNAINK